MKCYWKIDGRVDKSGVSFRFTHFAVQTTVQRELAMMPKHWKTQWVVWKQTKRREMVTLCENARNKMRYTGAKRAAEWESGRSRVI